MLINISPWFITGGAGEPSRVETTKPVKKKSVKKTKSKKKIKRKKKK